MLDFPFYSTIALTILFLPLGITILILAIREWRCEYRRRQDPLTETLNIQNPLEPRTGRLQRGLTVAAGLAFSLVGGFVLFDGGWEIYKFRNVDIARIAAFHIRRIEDEYHPFSSEVVEFTDRERIQEGLRTLKNCNGISPNHETFKDGYIIQLVFDDQNADQFYISAYASSTASAKRSSVEPHFSPARALNLGDYSCPSFQQWLAANIDPLFTDPPKRIQ